MVPSFNIDLAGKTRALFSRVHRDLVHWKQLLHMPEAIRRRDEMREQRREMASQQLLQEVGVKAGTPHGAGEKDHPHTEPSNGSSRSRENARTRARGLAERSVARTDEFARLAGPPELADGTSSESSEAERMRRGKPVRPWNRRQPDEKPSAAALLTDLLAGRNLRTSTAEVSKIQKKWFDEREDLVQLNLDSEEKWGADRLDSPVWDALPGEGAHPEGADDLIKPTPRTEVKTEDTIGVRGLWESCPAADREVQSATELPIVYQQIRTIVQHIVTSRPTVKSKGTVSDQVRRWFEVEVPIQTNYERTLDTFVQKIALQVLRYGVCPVWRQRSRAEEAGSAYTHPVYKSQRLPIVSWAIPNVETVEAFIDRKARARRWRQKREMWEDGNPRTYQYYDTFLARLPQHNSGKRFWTPPLVWPALYPAFVIQGMQEDLEEHSQQILPLLAYARVGSDKYKNGRITLEELRETKRTLDRVSQSDDTPVLKWFNEIETIEIQSRIEELIKDLAYWEREIRRGVGGSQLQDGEVDSGTRNTSDNLIGKEMIAAETIVPQIQMAFQSVATDKYFELGGTVDQIGKEEEPPTLYFEEIDKEKQIRREQHFTYVWQNEGLTHGEYREAIGKDVIPEKSDKMWSDLREPDPEATKATASSRANASSNGSTSSGKSNGD